jgi:hypothetical protein
VNPGVITTGIPVNQDPNIADAPINPEANSTEIPVNLDVTTAELGQAVVGDPWSGSETGSGYEPLGATPVTDGIAAMQTDTHANTQSLSLTNKQTAGVLLEPTNTGALALPQEVIIIIIIIIMIVIIIMIIIMIRIRIRIRMIKIIMTIIIILPQLVLLRLPIYLVD